METTVVFIQARRGSTRLPGKVLLPLGDRPVLAHVVQRCRAAAVGPVVVAAPAGPADDDVEAAALAAGAAAFRGPAQDVLGRFALAARAFPARHYVRVTADCPFLDPAVLAYAVRAQVAGDYDFTYNDVEEDYPHGADVEVMTAALLAWLAANARDAASREHVTAHLYDHLAAFKTFRLPKPSDYRWAAVHLALDTAADYELLKTIYERLKATGLFGLTEIGALLAAEPALAEINRRGPPGSVTAT